MNENMNNVIDRAMTASMYGGASGSVAAVGLSLGDTMALIGAGVAVLGFVFRSYLDFRKYRKFLEAARINEENAKLAGDKMRLEIKQLKARKVEDE